MEQTEQTNIQPIEKEFFVMTVEEQNTKLRIYPKSIVQDWIDKLSKPDSEFYKIEYAINIKEEELTNMYINDSLYCGAVYQIELRGNKVYAKAKFKVKGNYADEMRNNPEFFDNLTIVPKGFGVVQDDKITNYELFGFNLVEKERSTFVSQDAETAKETETAE